MKELCHGRLIEPLKEEGKKKRKKLSEASKEGCIHIRGVSVKADQNFSENATPWDLSNEVHGDFDSLVFN